MVRNAEDSIQVHLVDSNVAKHQLTNNIIKYTKKNMQLRSVMSELHTVVFEDTVHTTPSWEIYQDYVGSASPVGRRLIFRDANPHLPPPQTVFVVIGHYVNRYITKHDQPHPSNLR